MHVQPFALKQAMMQHEHVQQGHAPAYRTKAQTHRDGGTLQSLLHVWHQQCPTAELL